MKKVFLDSNVILDAILERDGHEAAARILQFGTQSYIKNCTSVLSFANIAYVLRKYCSPDEMGSVLENLFKAVTILPMGEMSVYNALRAKGADFEDDLQAACADIECCDLIVTRDKRHFRELPLPVYTPEEFYSAVTGD